MRKNKKAELRIHKNLQIDIDIIEVPVFIIFIVNIV